MALSVHANPNASIPDDIKNAFPASFENYMKLFEMLLKQDLDLDIQNNDGFTCLMVACQNRIPSAAKLLLQKGANPNVKDNKGCTPLDVAIKTKQADLVEFLLQYDAKNGALELVVDEFIMKTYLMMNKGILGSDDDEDILHVEKPLAQKSRDQKSDLASLLHELQQSSLQPQLESK